MFEPFVEAFGAFLNIEEIQDRTAAFDAIGRRFRPLRMWHRFLLRWERWNRMSSNRSRILPCTWLSGWKRPQVMLLILDDLQWLDADSKRLLEVFWGWFPKPKPQWAHELICTYREVDHRL